MLIYIPCKFIINYKSAFNEQNRIIKRLFFFLLIAILSGGCNLPQEDRNKYKWEVEKALSMQTFYLNKELNKSMALESSSSLNTSLEYINYIACLTSKKRLGVRFHIAKNTCRIDSKIKK